MNCASLPSWRLAECLEALQAQVHAATPAADLQWQVTDLQHQQALWIDRWAPRLAMGDKLRLLAAPTAIQVPIARDYFMQCVQAVAEGTPKPLPSLPDWLQSHQAHGLEQAELLCQHLSLYSWLSYQYPQLFNAGEALQAARKTLNSYISRALRLQAGYGTTQREADLARTRWR